jgi:hypothetical protein
LHFRQFNGSKHESQKSWRCEFLGFELNSRQIIGSNRGKELIQVTQQQATGSINCPIWTLIASRRVVLSTVSQSCDPPVAAPRFVPKQIPKVEVAQPVGLVLIIKRSANDGTSQQFGSFHSPSSLAGPCGTLDRHRGDRLSLLDRQLHLCLPASSRSGGSLYVTIDTNSNTQPKNH